MELDDEQNMAFYVMTNCRFAVVTGGPGRGKTATLKEALPHMGSVALCAPSGKAARRMAELTAYPASTVHRLLGLTPDTPRGQFWRGNPLPHECVVIDEASTLENGLLAQVLDACDVERTRVILIGDVDQLPSVGPGKILADIIESGIAPVVRLKTMHRAALQSWVCRQASEILEGRIDLGDTHDFQMVDADEDLIEATVDTAQQLVEAHGAEAVQVMVPMNVGDFGSKVLNPALQDAFNPARSELAPYFTGGGTKIREHDSVVCISNDYDRAVFNGETGRVVYIGSKSVLVDFGDREITYEPRSAASEYLRLSYALTVHKMQGSEVPWVVLALHEQHGPMLSRKLLYTALTRAKKGCVIVGQRSAVYRALSVPETVVRQTLLRGRLEELYEASRSATMEE